MRPSTAAGSSPTARLTRPCPACGGQAASVCFILPGGVYKKCASCGLVQVDPPPDAGEMQRRSDLWARAYHTDPVKVAQVFSAEFQQAAYRGFLDLLEPYRQCGRLLDLGCSIGGFIDAAQKAGWRAEGLDISPAVEVARQHGLTARQGRLEEQKYPPGHFDAISLFEVIEHIPDLDGLLKALQDGLRQGGVLLLVTPNLGSLPARLLGSSWPAVEPEDHLSLFTADTLGRLLNRYGLAVVKVETLDLNLGSLRRLARQKSTMERRQEEQRQRRRMIGQLVKSPLLLTMRNGANYFLKQTGLGERLVVLAERRPESAELLQDSPHPLR